VKLKTRSKQIERSTYKTVHVIVYIYAE